MGQAKQRMVTNGTRGTEPTKLIDAPSPDVTYAPATNVAWPQWVINEMSNAIYKARWEGDKDAVHFAALSDEARAPYVTMCRAALGWIEQQGWVKLGK
jgi:hypothetical protein